MANQTLVVGTIVDEGDRVLLYPLTNSDVVRKIGDTSVKTDEKELSGYYVITSRTKVENIKEGDTIEYEPYGANFGFLVKKINNN